jgi:uncharacterized surface protein with fasciclin (FAS1) repeats
MKLNVKIFTTAVIISLVAVLPVSCNKTLPEATPVTTTPVSGPTILKLLDDPDFSILKAAVTRAGNGITGLLGDSSGVFTFFAPNNMAFQFSGIPNEAFLEFLSPGYLDTALRYHILGGQKLMSADVSGDFPNMYLQSSLVLLSPSASLPPGYRMPIFPSKRGPLLWVNNIPVIQPDIEASNGVIHKMATIVAPPHRVIWDRIHNNPDFSYLEAAINLADSDDPDKTLQSALSNPAANLTVFAPTNLAFQQILTGMITQVLVSQGLDEPTAQATAAVLASSPDIFQNPAVTDVLTPLMVRGLLFYHILGVRVFSINMPVEPTDELTLLGSDYPGLSLQATFGSMGVTAASVKGFANPSPSNVLVDPTPEPGGTSDQHYINGTLHEIDQVLRLQ